MLSLINLRLLANQMKSEINLLLICLQGDMWDQCLNCEHKGMKEETKMAYLRWIIRNYMVSKEFQLLLWPIIEGCTELMLTCLPYF